MNEFRECPLVLRSPRWHTVNCVRPACHTLRPIIHSLSAKERSFAERKTTFNSLVSGQVLKFVFVLAAIVFGSQQVFADDLKDGELKPPIEFGTEYQAKDTLNIGKEASADAKKCLDGLKWPVEEFTVRCDKPPKRGDYLVRFPAPIKSGDALNDLVAMEWHIARDKKMQPMKAPAIVVVHESGSNMAVGRLFAKGLQMRGFHTFMIHLPHYGERRRGRRRPTEADLFTAIRQAVADVRRARDAVSVLPFVDASHIALQGTSLGGFVSATSASLDDGYDSVFLLLAGGELFDLIQNGKRDTAKVRQELEKAGLGGEKLRELVNRIEPTRIAHRLNPKSTWLYSGKFDTVVPLKNALALARSAKLDHMHHIHMNSDHYTGIVYLPFVISHIERQIRVAK
jgi:pimeloyl-ACP methyl ester carboxylesterase